MTQSRNPPYRRDGREVGSINVQAYVHVGRLAAVALALDQDRWTVQRASTFVNALIQFALERLGVQEIESVSEAVEILASLGWSVGQLTDRRRNAPYRRALRTEAQSGGGAEFQPDLTSPASVRWTELVGLTLKEHRNPTPAEVEELTELNKQLGISEFHPTAAPLAAPKTPSSPDEFDEAAFEQEEIAKIEAVRQRNEAELVEMRSEHATS